MVDPAPLSSDREIGQQLPTRLAPTLRHILVCLDRSPQSEAGIPHAIALARAFRSKLTLLHVMSMPHGAARLATTDALDREVTRHEAQGYLGRIQAHAEGCGVPTEWRLAQGHPAERISSIAHELDVDLAVLGSHGEKGLTAFDLGSTTQQVLSLARRSVLVARSWAPNHSEVVPRRIAVPLDGSPRSECVLPTVVRIASSYGAEVLLLHVVDEPVQSSVLSSREDFELARMLSRRLEHGARRYLDRVRMRLGNELQNVRAHVSRAHDERLALVQTADREGCDLIVLAAHGSSCNPARPFGSATGYLLAHGRSPLLVVQDLTRADLDRPAPATAGPN